MDTVNLSPNAAGDYANLDVNAGAEPNWTYVDDPPASPDEFGTYVRPPSSSEVRLWDAYNLEDTSVTGTINSVKVYFRVTASDGVGTSRPGLRLNGAEVLGTLITNPTSWTTYSEILARPGGGNWSWADINSLQALIGLTRPSTPTSSCTQVYVEVDYTPVTLHERTFTDELKVGDALIKSPIKAFSDGIALSDVLVKMPIKTLVDAIALSDVLEKVYTYVRSFTDGIAIADTLVKSVSKVLTDGIAFTDTLLKLWVHGVLRILNAVRNLPSVREEGKKR